MHRQTHNRRAGLITLASLSLALLLGLRPVAAQEAQQPAVDAKLPVPEVRTSVDRAVATTGDVIRYEVVVQHDPGVEVVLPEAAAEIAGFRIIDLGVEPPTTEDGLKITKHWYDLRADLVGSYILPPVTIQYRAVGSEKTSGLPTVGTSAIFVEVKSVLPTDGEVTDILGVKPLRRIDPGLPWWLFAGGGAGITLLLVGLLLWLRARRRGAQVVLSRPAHELAFEALEALRHTDFEDPQAVHLYYFAISEVLRSYVEGRFALNATDLTSEEILAQLSDIGGLPDSAEQLLRGFLVHSDQVKFADLEPTQEQITDTYEQALTFVETTLPPPEPSTPPVQASPQA